jgi:predicted alpha/beta superfamily hydrolase
MSYKTVLLFVAVLVVQRSFGQDPVVVGQKHAIHSRILNEDRSYDIYVPASYRWASDRRYPVLYLLDGESNFLHTAGSVSFLSSQGELPEVIVVAITSTVRVRDYTQTDWSSHWVGGGGAKGFKSFLSRELIPRIEKEYRTNGFRILSGHSAGGQFALYTLTSEPSLFNAYVAISPSLNWDDHLPQKSLEESFAHTDSMRAFLYFAWSDDSGQAFADDQRLLETLETKSPKGFRWVGKGFPDETHTSIPLLGQIDALRQLYAGYRFHGDLLEKGVEYAEKHFQAVSKLVGYAMPVPEDVINDLAYEELNKGRIQEAIVLFQRNANDNPNSANAFDGVADAYEKGGLWKEAIVSSEKAVELAEKYGDPKLGYYTEHTKKLRSRRQEEPAR